jgi:GntR family transcriptional regulator of vanillate catabolism
MPLVAPVAILFTNNMHDDAYARMLDAHQDHVQILGALIRREGERADYLMREHAYRSRERLGVLLKARATVGEATGQQEPRRRAKKAHLRSVG